VKCQRMFRHRSPDDLMFFEENGYWPEQRLRPRYYVQDGCFSVEWQFQPFNNASLVLNVYAVPDR
jgi:hypothetical protein